MFNRKKLVGQISISNFVKIKGYEGTLLVSLVPSLKPVYVEGPNGNIEIEQLICSASIPKTSSVLRNMIASITCEDIAQERIIIISKKFTHLSNKKQLALLQIEIEKAYSIDDRFHNNLEDGVRTRGIIESSSRVITGEMYGARTVKKACKKATKVHLKSEMNAAKILHKQFKADQKLEKKQSKGLSKNENTILEDLSHAVLKEAVAVD